jgi:hypothetical protein
MAITAVDEALRLMEDGDLADFVGERPEELVAAAEAALGFGFPPSYRSFVSRLGAGNFGSFEIYGIIDLPFEGPIPDAVWATLEERAEPSNLPLSMIVIGDDGMGGTYVLDTAKGVEPPVEVWNGGGSDPDDELERLAPTFGDFLLESVRDELADQ